jgi:hypothetical protein
LMVVTPKSFQSVSDAFASMLHAADPAIISAITAKSFKLIPP